MSSENKDYDEVSGTEYTGHEWDGIKELNTPMPKWWLGIMYLTIIWSIGYVIMMPGIPLLNGYTKGVLGFSDRDRVRTEMAKVQADRSVQAQQLVGADIETIMNDPDLLRFAMDQGEAVFGDNCETCHGARGRGFVGYPNLNDDIWLWGGTYEDIRKTITHGIRAEHDDTRLSTMAAYGRDGFLTGSEIETLVEFVSNLSGQNKATHSSSSERDSSTEHASGATLFTQNCVSCHGAEGRGTRENGAPDLTDANWLYGGDEAAIRETIFNGRQGMMPNWNERLTADQIAALSVYVHALGGGE